MPTSIKLQLNSDQEILLRRGLETDGRIQQMFTDEVYRASAKYTPFRTGTLQRNVEVGPDYIHYLSPYARYLWYGKVMVGKPPKQRTDKDLEYNEAPTRGKEWTNRMWAERGDEIVKALAKEAGVRPG